MFGSKHKSRGGAAGTAEKCQAITMETKVKIIERNMNYSTISTSLKNKDKIMKHVKSAMQMISTIISKKKAKNLYEDLQKKHREESEDESFTANHTWFHQFKARTNFHNIKISGEAVSAGNVAAGEFLKHFKKLLMKAHIYPNRLLIKEEKLMPGYKATKNRLSLLFGGNASGIMKLKAVKNIAEVSVPAVWKSNPKTWVTQAIFQDWLFHHFILEAEKHYLGKDIPFNILCITMNGVCKNLCPQFVHNCHGFENSKEVFSNLVMLSMKLKLDLKEDDVTEFLAVPGERTDKREEGTEQPNRFRMQEMTRGFSLFEEELLQQPFRIQSIYYHVIYDEKNTATTQTSLDHFFNRVDRIECSKESEPVPSTSGMSEKIITCPPSPIAEHLSALPSPTSFPSSSL
ncbi:hypothetical protein FD754_003644 [Muntiacus muntjak]|uniref:DDE-1 domain-containing protein n=1 Tax=Muntiacus muntjak TaxID=9888 RepID=A0A5N3WF97_MUNMU|nr:hypothetical protein FD754_003644 [Muntiacus muntjak]